MYVVMEILFRQKEGMKGGRKGREKEKSYAVKYVSVLDLDGQCKKI